MTWRLPEELRGVELEEWEKGADTPIEEALWHRGPIVVGLGLVAGERNVWACGRPRPLYVFVRRILPGGVLPGRPCGKCVRVSGASAPATDHAIILRERGFRV